MPPPPEAKTVRPPPIPHLPGAGASSGGGGDTSNTPPQTSHVGGTSLPMTGAEDWLEWSWSIAWNDCWADLRQVLERAKANASQNNGQPEHGNIDTVELNGYPALVSPGGARLGKGNKGPFMPWRVKWQGMVLLIADRPEPHRTLPSMVVRADGTSCLMARSEKLWARAGNLVTALGGAVVRERLSRVDPCLDLPGVDIAPLKRAYLQERFITRAKDHHMDAGSRGTTIYIGTGPQLRAYDKLAELGNRGNDEKRALMAFHRWCGIEPEAAMRVEFELGRKALTDRGIDTVSDYFERRADLVRYFAHDWVRFTKSKPDRTHTTRATTSPLWRRIQEGFAAWTGRPIGYPLEPLPRESIDTAMLIKSAAGMVMTAAVRRGQFFERQEQLLGYAVRELSAVLRAIDWQERMRRKSVDYFDSD